MNFRKATATDAKTLFEWRNDELTRANSFNSEAVPWANHVAWLEKTLANPKRQLFIALDETGNKVGTVRFDEDEKEAKLFEISWTVAPNWRGKGIGKKMIAAALTLPFLKGKEVKALIKKENIPSIKIAEAAGFGLKGEKEGVTDWRIPR